MTNIAPDLERFAVPIDSLKAYPGNARRGNLRAISESLKTNGQYKPIVVNRRTAEVLAGNHTWTAARQLGWERIAVTFVDVDPERARKIVLVDNRTADESGYDYAAVVALLEDLEGELDGTGYDADELARLRSSVDNADLFKENLGESAGHVHQTAEDDQGRIQVGSHTILVPTGDFAEWSASVVAAARASKADPEEPDGPALEAELRRRLELEGTAPPAKEKARKAKKTIVDTDAPQLVEEAELVSIGDLKAHPRNPRRGNIDAIAESLRVNGQYRPVVVNRPTMEILAGNHTVEAARRLGWSEVAVTFVDVDAAQAARIVLVDNRSGDLAYYDQSALAELLAGVDLVGTGYEESDVASLLKGVAEWDTDPTRQDVGAGPDISVLIKHNGLGINWNVVIHRPRFFEWNEALVRAAGYSDRGIRRLVCERLGIDAEVCV